MQTKQHNRTTNARATAPVYANPLFEQARKLKESFARDEVTLGAWIMGGSQLIAEALSASRRPDGRKCYDWIAIDMEHVPIGPKEVGDLIMAISRAGTVALVRMPDHDETKIKYVMDAGAAGIIVSHVNTVKETKRIVSAVRYPPLGTRGVGCGRAHGWGSNFDEYREWINHGSIIIPQTEHYLGVRNLGSVLEVEGIDGMFIGPLDLSASMGDPGNIARVEPLIQSALEIAQKHNRVPGVHVMDSDAASLRIRQGFRFLAYSTDIGFIVTRMAADVESIRAIALK